MKKTMIALALAAGLTSFAKSAKADLINFSFNGLTNTAITGTFELGKDYNGNGQVTLDFINPIYVAYSTVGGGTTNWIYETHQSSSVRTRSPRLNSPDLWVDSARFYRGSPRCEGTAMLGRQDYLPGYRAFWRRSI
jgi:hypothetical protein